MSSTPRSPGDRTLVSVPTMEVLGTILVRKPGVIAWLHARKNPLPSATLIKYQSTAGPTFLALDPNGKVLGEVNSKVNGVDPQPHDE